MNFEILQITVSFSTALLWWDKNESVQTRALIPQSAWMYNLKIKTVSFIKPHSWTPHNRIFVTSLWNVSTENTKTYYQNKTQLNQVEHILSLLEIVLEWTQKWKKLENWYEFMRSLGRWNDRAKRKCKNLSRSFFYRCGSFFGFLFV